MNELKLPEQLKGSWGHALILTYGMDIPFFENALLPEFSPRCRNKIILADGRQYLEASANYAQSGLVRYMNQRYIVEGIFSPRAAHAKLVMLTNSDHGRLLVGSGNLGLQGYASPGELFTQYEYAPEQTETLPAFLSGIDLIKGLIANGYVSETASRHFDRLLEDTPWLFQSTARNWLPVRHNLERSFIDQLIEVATNEAVEELWILSPFYDASAHALAETLARLQPQQATLLVQPGSTSVDPQALSRVIGEANIPCKVKAFRHREDSNLYFHAKLYLLKFKDRAVCLQGSPNLSQVAMLHTAGHGNVELANLMVGPRDYFDYLFDPLIIEPETSQIETLALSFQSDADRDTPQPTWQLRSGEWQGGRLTLNYQGNLPDLPGLALNIIGNIFPCTNVEFTSNRITLTPPAEAIELLKRAVPVMVQWGSSRAAITSNPIFVCNRAKLNEVMEAEESDKIIDRTGGLNLDDQELEQLVGELESHMVIDRQSIWQVAGRRPPLTTNDDDVALRLDYADIDYEMLRQHPKLRQYTAANNLNSGYTRTRLQIILGSITDHFQGLMDVASGKQSPTTAAFLDIAEAADSEEDIEEEAAERQRRQRSHEQRLRYIFKNFLRRYLRGISSPDFQDLAGYEVMAHNYIIFSHLLWALFRKEWFESETQFVIESLLKTWQFFWGTHEKTGYFQQQDSDTQAEMLKLVQAYHADAQILASLYHGDRLTQQTVMLRLALRDHWRYLMSERPFPVDNRVLEDTWIYVADLYRYDTPHPSIIVRGLYRLARFETEDNFLRSIENKCDLTSGSCYFGRVTARRTINYRQLDATVKCLFVSDVNNSLPREMAISTLRAWMEYEVLAHYRISFVTAEPTKKVLFYETADAAGVFWNEALGIEEDINQVTPFSSLWNNVLAELKILAIGLDSTITIPRPSILLYAQTG